MDEFLLGCNYWASHAGAFMWRQWRPEVVEEDFRAISQRGLRVLRVFPIWSDFQPITPLIGNNGHVKEIGFGEESLPDTKAGKAGVKIKMMERFRHLTHLAKKYDIKLIVGLLTGWMSGRQFIPPALYGMNILSNPTAIRWETKFVRFFVNYFKNDDSIIAWDFGNECNTLEPLEEPDQAWLWSYSIESAIRAEDDTRPVISGMHSLSAKGLWRIADQAEVTDILTTHPYPIFTPHCNNDPLNTMRPILHAAAESLLYAGIGEKPCLVEEAGALTGCISGDRRAADYLRASLYCSFAHNLEGYLWWCAFDQAHIPNAPYGWHFLERELGLMKASREPKQMLKEMESFHDFAGKLPFKKLPDRITDGICILGSKIDEWGVAYNAFTLALRAGLELEFQYADAPIRDAKLYVVPSIAGYEFFTLDRFNELMEKVYDGATLYLSMDCPYLGEYEKYFGITLLNRYERNETQLVTFTAGEGFSLVLRRKSFLDFDATDAQVLAEDEKGRPAFVRNSYGKGIIYLLNFPIEANMIDEADVFEKNDIADFHKVYNEIYQPSNRAVNTTSPDIVTTEHPLNENERICISVNCAPRAAVEKIRLNNGWKIEKYFTGDIENIEPCNAAVYMAVKK